MNHSNIYSLASHYLDTPRQYTSGPKRMQFPVEIVHRALAVERTEPPVFLVIRWKSVKDSPRVPLQLAISIWVEAWLSTAEALLSAV